MKQVISGEALHLSKHLTCSQPDTQATSQSPTTFNVGDTYRGRVIDLG